MGYKIICIGREFGSGGHEIAVRLGEVLDLKVYEKNLIHLACNYGELAVKDMEGADEKTTNPYLYQTVHQGNYHVTRGLPTSEVLYDLQSQEIRRIASEESCIFVGRCADFVLRDADVRLLSVFVHASTEYRIQRKMEQEKLSHLRAKQVVRKMDLQRKKYYEHYTGRIWGAPEYYDLYIDSERTGMDGAVEQIAEKYRTL